MTCEHEGSYIGQAILCILVFFAIIFVFCFPDYIRAVHAEEYKSTRKAIFASGCYIESDVENDKYADKIYHCPNEIQLISYNDWMSKHRIEKE